MKEEKKRPKPSLILQKVIAIIMLLFILVTLVGATVMGITTVPNAIVPQNQEQLASIENTVVVEQIVDNNDIPIPEEVVVEEIDNTITAAAEVEETYTELYTNSALNIRKGPSTNDEIVKTVSINTVLKTVDNSEQEGWIKIKEDNNDYYVSSKYLSKKKTEIRVAKVSSRHSDEPRPESTKTGAAAHHLTKAGGVFYFNGHKETWYSQKVLPGGGLKIPGRHVASDGTVRDDDDYICVASSDYTKGTIVQTSLGTGKVYDCGCASGTIDIYVNW